MEQTFPKQKYTSIETAELERLRAHVSRLQIQLQSASYREVLSLRAKVARLVPLEFLLAKGGDPMAQLAEAVVGLSDKLNKSESAKFRVPMAPHTFAQMVNRVRDLAFDFGTTEQFRDRVSELLGEYVDDKVPREPERKAVEESGPVPDHTGEGSAWVPPVEARAVVVPEPDEVENLRDTVRFLASVVSKGAQIRHQIIFSLHENKPDEAKDYAMMKWPIIQGMQNQIDLEKVGKQAYTPKRIRLAVDSLIGIRANQGGPAT